MTEQLAGFSLDQSADATVLAWGAYFRALIDDRSWINRRVETVTLLDRNRTEKRVSLDLAPTDLAVATKRLPGSDTELLLPVEILEKRLLVDFDVNDEAGALTVVSSDVDSAAAYAVMLHAITADFPDLPIPDSARQRLFRLVRHNAEQEYADLLFTVGRKVVRRPRRGLRRPSALTMEPAERHFWRSVLLQTHLRDRLANFVLSYLLIVRSNHPAPTSRLIKLRYSDQQTDFTIRLLQQLSLLSFRIPVATDGIGSASREHTRVVAPTGTRIIDAVLMRGIGQGRPVPLDRYQRRITFDRAAIYTNDLPLGRYTVWVYLLARSGRFTVPSILSTLLMGSLAATMYAVQLPHTDLNWLSTRSGSLIALLTLVPSLTLAYFVRPGDHDLVGRLLLLPRGLVLLGALPLLGVAVALALNDAALVQVASYAGAWINAVVFIVQTIGLARVQIAVARRRDINRYNAARENRTLHKARRTQPPTP